MLKKEEIKKRIERLNWEASNWASMTPGGYSYITVNCDGIIDLDVHSVGDIFEYNYERVYPIIAPATLKQVLKALNYWGIKYE